MPDELERSYRSDSRGPTDGLSGYVLISRRGCHLCEDAEEALRAASLPFEWRDVDADPELRCYTFRVPVLLHEGTVVLEGPITQDKLMKALDRIEEC